MSNRTILHADLNHCFAAIELLSHPEWRGKPLAVCGESDERHGIVLAKSPEAKRYGIKTGEVVWQAKLKCPELIIAPAHYRQYLHYSRLVRSIYLHYTDLVEPFGLDECWLDVTKSMHLFGTGEEIAYQLKEEVKAKTGLTVSVGVSFCKMFAKLGSDLKKPDAVTCIPKTTFRKTVWPLPVESIMGVGPATLQKMQAFNIHTLGDFAALELGWVQKRFGVNGIRLWHVVHGYDEDIVHSFELATPPPKSISHGMTYDHDLKTLAEIDVEITVLAEKIAKRLRHHALCGHKIQLSIRSNDFVSKQLQIGLNYATSNAATIAKEAQRIFKTQYDFARPIRALSIGVMNLRPNLEHLQTSYLSSFKTHQKYETVDALKDKLQNRYGKTILTPAALLLSKQTKTEEEKDIFTLPNQHHL